MIRLLPRSIAVLALPLLLAMPGSTSVESDALVTHGVRATFGAHGADVTLDASGAQHVRIGLASLGRDGSPSPVPRARVARTATEVSLARGRGIREWWRSEQAGLEHGVTLSERPAGAGPLVLEIAIDGDLETASVDGDGIALVDDAGVRRARYAALDVRDARGVALAAQMHASAIGARIEIADEGAVYPIVVDPLVAAEEATLVASDGATGDQLGGSIAISADGMRAVVGAPRDDTALGGADAGSVRVFVRTGITWAPEATLLPAASSTSDRFGTAVDVSADGTRAIVGAPNRAAGRGAAYIFFRTGSTWSQEQSFSGGVAGDAFGAAVAISADGSRAIVGSSSDDVGTATDAGSAQVYVRSGVTWSADGALLTRPAPLANDFFGTAVDLDATGSRALVGAPFADDGAVDQGAAHVFVRTAGWAHETTLPTNFVGAYHGSAVALSDDGLHAVVGTPGAEAARAYHFTTSWMFESALAPPVATTGAQFGGAVDISGDGTRAIVGSVGSVGGGGASMFVSSAGAWTRDAPLLAQGGVAGDRFGVDVALDLAGSRALVGAFLDDTTGGTDTGSARVFRLSVPGSTCTVASDCAGGLCIDGVCCASACAACEACSVAAGGSVNGTCTTMTAVTAAARTCRAMSGACDVAETCMIGLATCPADGFLAGGTTCRAQVGPCDVREACSGVSGACPTDGVAGSGTVCRSDAGNCDVEDTCDGVATGCPNVVEPAGTTCRPSAGLCDVAESCDGTMSVCPLDAFAAPTTVCLPSLGACDPAEMCTGAGPGCPADVLRPAGFVCAASGGDVCDAPDLCTGTSADCMPTFASGVVCRPAAGGCDVAESCSGSNPSCPPDGVLAAGVSCRTSTDPACDPAETCDGTESTCPTDVVMCDAGPPMPDAGIPTPDAATPRDAATPADATSGSDAATTGNDAGTVPPPMTGACGCRAGGGRDSLASVALLGLAVVLGARRRRVTRAA